jgi:hypothetical protein
MIGTATRDADERVQEGATSIEAPADGLWRYARWQMKDFVTQKASILMLLAVLLMYPIVAGTFNVSPTMERFAREMREQWLYVMFGVLAPLGTLMTMRGIVSEDRQRGFHRFLFAKPVNLARYYAQQIGVNFVGLMGVLAVVALLFSLVVGPVALLPAFVPAAVFFVLFGGVTFFFSTVSRMDWVWTVGAVAASAWTRFAVADLGWTVLAPLSKLLLPLGAFGRMVYEWGEIVDGTGSLGAALASTAWPLAYGAAAFAAGIWVLKRRAIIR